MRNAITVPFSLGLDQARRFNGTSDYAQLALNLSSLSKFTLSFWLYWDAYANTDNLAMEFTATVSSNDGSFYVNPNNSTGAFVVGCRGTTGLTQKSFTRPSVATWHHYAIHLDAGTAGANAVPAVYVDGSSQTLTTVASASASGNFANSTLNFMGRNGGASLQAAGRIKHLAGFPSVLLAAGPIADLAAGKNPLTVAGVRPLFYLADLNGLAGSGVR